MTPEEIAHTAETTRLWTGPYSWGYIAGYRLDLSAVLKLPPEGRPGFT